MVVSSSEKGELNRRATDYHLVAVRDTGNQSKKGHELAAVAHAQRESVGSFYKSHELRPHAGIEFRCAAPSLQMKSLKVLYRFACYLG